MDLLISAQLIWHYYLQVHGTPNIIVLAAMTVFWLVAHVASYVLAFRFVRNDSQYSGFSAVLNRICWTLALGYMLFMTVICICLVLGYYTDASLWLVVALIPMVNFFLTIWRERVFQRHQQVWRALSGSYSENESSQ